MNFEQSIALCHCHVKQNPVLLQDIYEYKQELTFEEQHPSPNLNSNSDSQEILRRI